MELNNFLSTVPRLLYLWSHAHLLTELVKRKTFCIRLDTCSQKIGADFTTHGFLFMDEKYHFIEFSSHGLNTQEPFLTYQLISVALHGASLHPTAVYISDLVEHIILLP